MKKVVFLSSIFVVLLLAGCGPKPAAESAPDSTDSAEPTASQGETDASQVDYGYGAGLLPLGNDAYYTSPKVGYVYSCVTSFNGGGAFKTGEWINENGGYWNPNGKVTVDGDVSWPQATVSIETRGDTRNFVANGLPTDHTTGIFPVQTSDDAYDYDRNPNTIQAQDVLFSLSTNPQIAAQPHCISMGAIGYALNGVAIFNAFDAAGRDAPAYEIQDHCGGHPQQQGMYHYHNLSECFDDSSGEHSELWGYVLDGFGIYGPNGDGGVVLTNDDLDACHGHVGSVEWDGEKQEMYHYHATHQYPYTIGCYKGEVEESVLQQFAETPGGQSGGGQPSGQSGGPPPPRR